MTSKLWYRGPSIDSLHEDYAKHGRIDERAAVHTSRTVDIDAPVATVWQLLSEPAAWPTWAPGIHDVEIEAPTAVDTRFVWSSGRSRMRSRFAVVEPGREITWTGVSSGAKAVHRHVLESPTPDTTHVACDESMAGTMLGLFYDSDKMQTTIDAWLSALKFAAERLASSER